MRGNVIKPFFFVTYEWGDECNVTLNHITSIHKLQRKENVLNTTPGSNVIKLFSSYEWTKLVTDRHLFNLVVKHSSLIGRCKVYNPIHTLWTHNVL